jgi:glycine/sarcosine N-methyltransferase
MGPSQFYDDLAEYYDLIYADWVKSMAHQGGAIAQMLEGLFPERGRGALRILDVGAGVGTQSLPLAELGYQITARDLSPGAISRLSREATSRGLSIDAAPADMRSVSESVEGVFDAIIAFDNCIPHLQTDSEIADTLRHFRERLSPGGSVLLSLRDYDQMDRTPTSTHRYGERARGNRRYRIEQHWRWLDSSHYRTTFVIEELRDGEWTQVTETDAVYYAIPISRLLELMGEAGFLSCRLSDVPFFQPVLTGRNAG